MDEPNQSELSWEPFVWRGALGGTIGMIAVVVVAIVYVLFRGGIENLSEVFLIMGVFGLVSGVLTGSDVGYVIYKITRRWKTQPTIAVRIAIGTICVLAYGLLTSLTAPGRFIQLLRLVMRSLLVRCQA